MVYSMTGYGRVKTLINNKNITVEIKSVNNRYLDINIRAPKLYGFLDEPVRKHISGNVSRGKFDVYLSIEDIGTGGIDLTLNNDVLEMYFGILNEIETKHPGVGKIDATSLLRFPDVIVHKDVEFDTDIVIDDVMPVVREAMDSFLDMRRAEGERLAADILKRVELLFSNINIVEGMSDGLVEEYRNRMFLRMKDILKSSDIDEQRILMEAAIFADKTSIDEEIVRIYSHLHQLKDFVESGGAVGRKLDFIVQEINREINTIGSKSNDINISRIVVEFKSDMEKIREQIQNIE